MFLRLCSIVSAAYLRMKVKKGYIQVFVDFLGPLEVDQKLNGIVNIVLKMQKLISKQYYEGGALHYSLIVLKFQRF